MKRLNDYFDHIFYINSKKRIDRKRNIEFRLDSLEIKADRFEAILGGSVDQSKLIFGADPNKVLNNGEIGCYLSHVEIWKTIKRLGYKKTLILEDDAFFIDNLKSLEQHMEPVPEDYDMLYFGQWNYDNKELRGETTALIDRVPGSDNLYTANRCWLTHAYAVDIKCIDHLIDGTTTMYSCLDNVIADIQNSLSVYAFYPALIKQDGTKSSLR